MILTGTETSSLFICVSATANTCLQACKEIETISTKQQNGPYYVKIQ